MPGIVYVNTVRKTFLSLTKSLTGTAAKGMNVKYRPGCVPLFVLAFITLTYGDIISGVFFNPGIKIGYQFGKSRGFLVGFEGSVTYVATPAYVYTGIVGGIEFNVRRRKFIEYWEIEGGMAIFGVALGGEWNDGYHGSFRVFTGALGFISYKHLFNTDIHEIGLIGKRPVFVYVKEDHGTYSIW